MKLCKYIDENTVNVDGAILYGTTLFLCRAFNKQLKENNDPDEEWMVDINIPETGEAEEVKYRFYSATQMDQPVKTSFIKELKGRKNFITITMDEHSLLSLLDSVLHNQLFLPSETTTGDATVVQLNIQEDKLIVKQAICSVTKFSEHKKTALKMCKFAEWSDNTTVALMPFKVFLVYMKEIHEKFIELQSQGFEMNPFELHIKFEKEFAPNASHFQFKVVPDNPETLLQLKKNYSKSEERIVESLLLKMTYADFEMIMMPAYHRLSEKVRKNSFMQKDTLMVILTEDEKKVSHISFRYKEKNDVWED